MRNLRTPAIALRLVLLIGTVAAAAAVPAATDSPPALDVLNQSELPARM